MEGKFELQFEDNEYYLVDGNTNDTVATTDNVLLKEYDGYMKKLSLKNCEAIANGYDLDELAKDACNITDPLRLDSQKYKQDPYFRIGFNKGFQKALEILGDKKFSEEDVKFMFQLGFNLDNAISRNEYNAHIQSLQQTQWSIEIEMICPHPSDTYKCGIQYGCDEDGCNHPNQVPYLDAECCLILKRKV